MPNIVPYTSTYSNEDLDYLGKRLAKSPKISELLDLGKIRNDLRELAEKLDLDAGVSDTDYTAEVVDDAD